MADAEAFANAHNMSEYAGLFGRAALVARDQRDFMSIPSLSQDERDALEYERDHKWHGSKMLWFSISLCAIGAATQGESGIFSKRLGKTDIRLGSDRFKRCQLVLPRRVRDRRRGPRRVDRRCDQRHHFPYRRLHVSCGFLSFELRADSQWSIYCRPFEQVPRSSR